MYFMILVISINPDSIRSIIDIHFPSKGVIYTPLMETITGELPALAVVSWLGSGTSADMIQSITRHIDPRSSGEKNII